MLYQEREEAMDKEWHKQFLAEAEAQIKRDIAAFEARKARDPYRSERQLLMLQLSRARDRKKLTQSQLAKQLGVRQSAISRLENGRGNPSLNTLLAIAKALDVRLVLE